MYYFVKELLLDEKSQKTAGVKARDDADEIFIANGFQELRMEIQTGEREKENAILKVADHWKIRNAWEACTQSLKREDYLFIQFPCVNHTLFLSRVFKRLANKGIKIVLLIHDLELLRASKRKDFSLSQKLRIQIEEKSTLMQAFRIIAHNDKMRNFLVEIGLDRNKIVSLEIFDYLMKKETEAKLNNKTVGRQLPIVIAGTLRPHKAQYAYHLPENQKFNLYGVGYEGFCNDIISYKGAFEPDEVPCVMEGSFGLVWDGVSSDTCTGVYGEYLKINNPHKTSLYLSSGLPVIIWKEAALSEFVCENNCGITVNSLSEIPKKISELSDEEYKNICEQARIVGSRMRKGFYLSRAVEQCIKN